MVLVACKYTFILIKVFAPFAKIIPIYLFPENRLERHEKLALVPFLILPKKYNICSGLNILSKFRDVYL